MMLRHTAFNGQYGKIRMLYSLKDPWEMASEREQYRFQQTMEQLRTIAPHFGSVLELGCGEGHQSVFLSSITDTLDGIDISQMAVQRAADRCPTGRFAAVPLEEVAAHFGDRHFDLITACEVFYYATDITDTLTVLQERTNRLYVSNFRPRAVEMQAHFQGDGWRSLNDIAFEDTIWNCSLWEKSHTRQT